MDFIKGEFDKLLLTALLLVFCGMAVRGYCTTGSALAAFGADQAKEFGGALLGLITGYARAAAIAKAAPAPEKADSAVPVK